MSLYTLIIVTFIVFMAINVIIGLRGRKHASTTKDFLTASGQSGIWFIIASAVGASIGSGVVIGTTQYAVKLGVAGAWYAIACGLACLVHAFVMTRFIYRNKLVSFSDYFKRRYDSNFIILLYSGIGPFACAASMGGQLVAAKAIFQAFGIDPTIGLVITAAVMLVYTRFAGLWGSYATAVFQVGVIIVGVLVVGISMFTQGGIAEIHAFYPAEKFDLFNISPELWMMFVGPMVLSVLVDQTSVQRAASAKTEATAFWGHLLSCIPLFLFGWLMVYIGMWSGAEFPDAGGNAFIVMLMNKVSPIVCAVMICAILAAIMSTASGALVATDALVVHDLYCGFINKNATEEQQKRLNLIVNIVVSVAAVVCALAFTNVIDLLSVGYTIMLSGTLVPLLGGIIWKRGTTKGAAASAAVGMITALLSIFGVITVPFSSIFPVLPGAVTYIVVSLCTKHAPCRCAGRSRPPYTCITPPPRCSAAWCSAWRKRKSLSWRPVPRVLSARCAKRIPPPAGNTNTLRKLSALPSRTLRWRFAKPWRTSGSRAPNARW